MNNLKEYNPCLTVSLNKKGVLDIDTVKGCTLGMIKHPKAGCYDNCYAYRIATARGFNFRKSISRKIHTQDKQKIENIVKRHPFTWFRIGVMGDPCHDWPLTIRVCEWLGKYKTPIIITKHWKILSNEDLERLSKCNTIINTSVSALDSLFEIIHRLDQFEHIKKFDIKSILRIVSAHFGNTEMGKQLNHIQDKLFKHRPYIDNPLRIPSTDIRVKNGDILINKLVDLETSKNISKIRKKTYIGHCFYCHDQCGVNL